MEELANIVGEELEQLIEDIIRFSRNAGQEASGQTYQNIKDHVDKGTDYVKGSVTAPVYFSTLIRGRGPAHIPANLPELIAEWAQYKGITFQTPEDALRFARATAWKIRREGSELYRNHLYIDIVDTPIKMFEERLKSRIDSFMKIQITRNLNADGQAGHGFII